MLTKSSHIRLLSQTLLMLLHSYYLIDKMDELTSKVLTLNML